MVNFFRYAVAGSGGGVDTFAEAFQRLDRKTSHAGAARPQQQEAMAALESRRDKSSTVLRMGTGGGKTVLGLVYLHKLQKESKQPVVYLCPTRQLVEQVMAEAKQIGVNAVEYPAGERHPHPDAVAGEAILVCTYQKLLNGKNTFNHEEVALYPYAMVLDDAHVGASVARDCFTVTLKGERYLTLRKALGGAGAATSRSQWERVENDDPSTVVELPFWAWKGVQNHVRSLLEEVEGDHSFAWKNIRDHLELCRCVVSGTSIELLPDAPLLSINRAYGEVRHRLFMSATLPDEGALVRDLACDEEAALNPIQPGTGVGIGERMVLAPTLVDPALHETWVLQVAKSLATHANVVALCSSEAQQRKWESVGATVALGEEVTDLVRDLHTGNIRFAALAQRFDGVDLPDDACRVLIIDGIPTGRGLAEGLDSAREGYPGGRYARWAFRLEQGMGRAVRSDSDYCVVILNGPELASFVGKHEVRDRFSPGTQAQLELSREIARMAREEGRPTNEVVWDTIHQCLRRDEGWKAFYRQKMAAVASVPGADRLSILVASAVRKAIDMATQGRFPDAVDVLGALLRDCDTGKLAAPDDLYGWVLQLKALLTAKFDEGQALKVLTAAHKRNGSLLAAPDSVSIRPPKTSTSGQQILDWYKTFADGNAAVAAFQTIRARLAFTNTPNDFEAALEELFPLLGAVGQRPEKKFGRGPDGTGFWPQVDWVVEAKTGKENLVLNKDDGEQLLSSMRWYAESYPERGDKCLPVIVANTTQKSRDAFFPPETRVMTPDALCELLRRVGEMLGVLTTKAAEHWTPSEVAKVIASAKLTTAELIACLVVLR